jgi:phage N-6-adenine-methyltransferase
MSQNFNVTKKNKTDSWVTPKWIIDKIGLSDLDPSGYRHPEKGILVETARKYYFIEDDGLNKEWVGTVFLNPPYSQNKLWMAKMAAHNNGIVLIFARTETIFFQDYVKNATGINFLKRRVKFIDEHGNIRSNGNAPSCLIAYSEENYKRIKNIEGIYCRIDK